MYERQTFALVIFDCDGVLIDSEPLAIEGCASIFAEHGLPVNANDIKTRYVGTSLTTMLADVALRAGGALPGDLGAQIEARVAALFEARLQPMPGIAALLDALQTPRCVASSSGHARLKHALSLAGLYQRLAPSIFSASDVARGKPAPDLFLFAAARMKAEAGRCLVIEDSVLGIEAAKAAGMTAYGYRGGSHCDAAHGARLKSAGADAVFDSMAGLAAALSQIA